MPSDLKTRDGRYVLRRRLVDATTGVELVALRVADTIPSVASISQGTGYDGCVTGQGYIDLYFTKEPTRQVIEAVDAYFAVPSYAPERPSSKEEYAALRTDSERIAFIARTLRLA